MNRTIKSAFAVGVAFTAVSAAADIRWDEDIDGDLSSDNFNPTLLAFGPGSNMVFGDTAPEPNFDPDFFTFVIPAGFELSSVIFEEYDRVNEQSFFAVEVGSQITDTGDPSGLLSALLIGTVNGTMQGDELLDNLQNPNVFGGFNGNLGPGTYTFWFQETSVETNYGFDFVLTPIPAPASIAVLSGGLLLARRRR
ncbi:MAG: hypothetical protein Phyf2KO_15770 [Phycisphaerales bacterium]